MLCTVTVHLSVDKALAAVVLNSLEALDGIDNMTDSSLCCC